MPDRLIANSKVAALVSDPRLPDNPIIHCNDAFVQLTGYSRDEIIGRNCRFLCGEKTEPECTDCLREAIRNNQPTLVELTNYRKDGTPFRNAVMIAPIFDDNGELAYFLGSQVEVPDETHQRGAEARSQAVRLSPRQKQVLQGLAEGKRNKQIAYDLSLSERTVKLHRAALFRALDVKTSAEAIRIAIEAGL